MHVNNKSADQTAHAQSDKRICYLNLQHVMCHESSQSLDQAGFMRGYRGGGDRGPKPQFLRPHSHAQINLCR